MKKFVYAGLILLGLSSAAYAGCTSTTLSQCPSPNYNSVKSGAYTDSSGNPMAGVWSGIGFGYTTPPSVAQMAASLSASPQPVTFAAITGSSLYVTGNSTIGGTEAVTGAFTPTGGIVANSTGATPATGNVGHPYTASNSGVTLGASAITNMTSITLSPGNYNCGGDFGLGNPAAADQNVQAMLSTISQNVTTGVVQPAQNILVFGSGGLTAGSVIQTGNAPLLVTSTETLYLVVYSIQSTTSSNGNMYCTRVQ